MADDLTKTELVEKIVQLIPNLDRHYLQSQNSIEQLKVMLEAHEHLLEELKPINYLSPREFADRDMNNRLMNFLDIIWRRITGQPEMPQNFLGIMFGVVVYGLILLAVYAIPIYTGRFFGWWE